MDKVVYPYYKIFTYRSVRKTNMQELPEFAK